MSDDDGAIEALAKSVNSIESARRVGWAKSYDANEREQEALRNLNVARGDLAVLSKFAALVYGILMEVAPGAEHLAARDPSAVLSRLPGEQLRKGHNLGKQWVARLPEVAIEAERRALAQERKARAVRDKGRTSQRQWDNARRAVEKTFLNDYGIPNRQELHAWLSQYKRPESE